MGDVLHADAREPDLFGFVTPEPERYPASPGFKAGGTSAEAAEQIAPLVGRLQREALEEFKAAGDRGLIPDECARLLGRSLLSIRPRCTELKAAGYLEQTDERRRNDDTGMMNTVLRATPKAFEVAS